MELMRDFPDFLGAETARMRQEGIDLLHRSGLIEQVVKPSDSFWTEFQNELMDAYKRWRDSKHPVLWTP